MTYFKKISASQLWFLVSLIWASLAAAAVWNWGQFLSVYGYYPLASNIYRLYALFVIFLMWITGLLYYLTTRKPSAPSGSDTTDIMAEQPSEPQFQFNNSGKELYLVAHLGVQISSLLTEQIVQSGLCDPIIASKSFHDRQSGWIETSTNYYAECHIARLNGQKNTVLWKELISEIARRKTAHPIDRLILTIDCITITDEQQWQNAQASFTKLTEHLRTILGYVPPIYTLVRDAEQIIGLNDYFQCSSDLQDETMLGIALPVSEKTGVAACKAMLIRQFGALQKDIEKQLIEKLHRLTDQQNAYPLFCFPARLACFLNWYQQRLEQLAICLTGIGAMPPRVATLCCSTTTNNRFLNNILLFIQNDAAATDSIPAIRMRKRKRYASLAILILPLVAISVGGWVYLYQRTQKDLAAISAKLKTTDAALSEISANPLAEVALSDVLKPLTLTRQLIDGQNDSTFSKLITGLSLSSNLTDAHNRLAEKYLLPKVVQRLEADLRAEQTDNASLNELFDALALYLNLTGQVDLSEQDQQFLLDNAFQTSEQDFPPKDQLIREIANLFRINTIPILADQSLITQAQSKIVSLSQTDRALYLLEKYSVSEGLTPWRASDIIETETDNLLSFRNREARESDISGLYTQKGFNTVVIPHFPRVLQSIMKTEKVWPEKLTRERSVLAADILTAYSKRFNAVWTEYVRNICCTRIEQNTEADKPIYVDQQKNYEEILLKLLKNIADQTSLKQSDMDNNIDILQANIQSRWKDNLPFTSLREWLKGTNGTSSKSPLAAQLFSSLKQLKELKAQLNAANDETDNDTKMRTQLLEQYRKLKDLAQELPFPLNVWVEQFSKNSRPLLDATIQKSLSDAWDKKNAASCRILNNLYPFKRDARDEITLEDFTSLFGPQGTFTQFIDNDLKPYTEKNATPWRWRKNYTDVLNQPFLDMFEKADLIRRGFFRPDQKTPSFTITVRPQKLPQGVDIAMMQIGNTYISASAEQNETVTVRWPDVDGNNSSKILIFDNNWQEVAQANGPWSLFRLLDQGKTTKNSEGQYRVSFQVRGKAISFLLDFSAFFPADNRGLLEQFRCVNFNKGSAEQN